MVPIGVIEARYNRRQRRVRRGVQPSLRRFLAFFLPAATVGVLSCLVGYALVQQDLRQSADDPQVQLAEDAVASLDGGSSPASVLTGRTVDVAKNLAPYLVIYDKTGTVLASSGSLDGKAPMPPAGVLTGATQNGFDQVTWQPRPGVRSAIVVMPWSGGTVLAGRSLRRIEEIEANIERLALAVAAVVVVAAVVTAAAAAWLWPRRPGESAEAPGG